MISLRERKKIKTMALVQREALDLFLKQGYDATTVEQIAQVTEISLSTFFRYFPTKEAVVFYDSLNPLIIETLRRQPRHLTFVQALRKAVMETYSSLPKERWHFEQRRGELIYKVPKIRTAALGEAMNSVNMLAEIIAERTNRRSDEQQVRNLAGAAVGVGLVVMQTIFEKQNAVDPLQLMDDALAQLEKGLDCVAR